jgi:hypothetical protein
LLHDGRVLIAASTGSDSIGTVVAENDAERMAAGIGEDPEVFIEFAGDTG